MRDVERPGWWRYPPECRYGRPWGPGLIIVSWLPCGCTGGDGHLRVSCTEPACTSVWYSPQHVPCTEVTGAYPPPAPGGIGGSWLRITEAERSRIIALARSVPPGRLARDAAGELSADDERGPAQWTLDTLSQAARDAGIRVGRSQVRRILLAEKVRWRRTRSWAASTDPEFAPKGPRSWNFTPPRRRAPPSSAPASSAR